MSDDLIAFIRARLDEDGRDLRHGDEWPQWNLRPSRFGARLGRALRELDAKRRIVELHQPANPDAEPEPGLPGYPDRPWLYCSTCGSGEPNEYPVTWPCETSKLLALPYSDHPDYREEWRP